VANSVDEIDDELSVPAQDLVWIVESFARVTGQVVDAILVSPDGLLLAIGGETDQSSGERLSAIASGMSSLAANAGESHGLGRPDKIVVNFESGTLVVMPLALGALLGVVVETGALLSTVTNEMATLINRVNGLLTPELVWELQDAVL
jgi:predicted regulator of Ras-like GTPase activity (Roadblock/LC7/MglB family)